MAVCVGLCGCGGSTGNNAMATSDLSMPGASDLAMAATPDLATGPDMAVLFVTLNGKITDFTTMKAVVGAKVCVYPAMSPCATTDDGGSYSVELPASNAATGVLVSDAAGQHLSTLSLLTSATDNSTDSIFLMSSGTATLLYNDGGLLVQAGLGILAATATDKNGKPLAGASFTIRPPTGVGPYYFNAQGMLDPNATSTNSSGLSMVIGSPSGDYTLQVTGPPGATSCSLLPSAPTGSPVKYGWKIADPAGSTIRIIADTVTSAAFSCK
jgi:hypothetical protein